MKRCNYFSSLVVVFLLFFGLTLNAQSYLPSADAIKAVNSVISQNTGISTRVNSQTYPTTGIAGNIKDAHANMDRPTKIKALKIAYGHTLLANLNAGVSVADALNKATAVHHLVARKNNERDLLQEVELFFKNLLSR